MHFFKALMVGASAFAMASAQLAFTSTPTSVTAGTQYTLTYTGATGPVQIVLRKGTSTDLGTITTLTSDSTGGSYTWTPATSLPNGSDYAFEIIQGTVTNYAGPFALSGGSTASASGSSSASASSSASVSSSASSASASSKASSSASSSMSMSSSTVSASSVTGTSSAKSSSSSGSMSASTTKASTTTTAASGTLTGSSAPKSTNAADSLSSSSPLAFVLCAIAAMLYIN